MASEYSAAQAGSFERESSCDIHGAFTQKVINLMGTEIKTPCPTCQQIKRDEDAAKEAASAAFMARMRLQDKMGAALIPKRFNGKRFESYRADTAEQRKALQACMDYAESFEEHFADGRCLIMMGKPGTGKTHLAAAIATYIMESYPNHSAMYRTVGGILQALKESYDRGSDVSESRLMSAMATVGLLIIDEVGATKPSEFELATLFAIVNSRYEEQRPTLVISNLNPDQLGAAMGERCVDRLREGGGIALVFNWASVRKDLHLRGDTDEQV